MFLAIGFEATNGADLILCWLVVTLFVRTFLKSICMGSCVFFPLEGLVLGPGEFLRRTPLNECCSIGEREDTLEFK